jgi:hypothetical protein
VTGNLSTTELIKTENDKNTAAQNDIFSPDTLGIRNAKFMSKGNESAGIIKFVT